MMSTIPANERELVFERGGLSCRLMQRIGLVRGDDPSVRHRIIAFLVLTLVPLLILCLSDGRAVGARAEEPFVRTDPPVRQFLPRPPVPAFHAP